MARSARIKFEAVGGWYHLFASVAGQNGVYPLSKPLVQHKLLEIIKFYTRAYCCECSAFSIMGNHYHLVMNFEEPRTLSREALMARALKFYPKSKKQIEAWPEEKWANFAARIFDVSEFMRNIQSAFARWYNHSFNRKGRFWADRFKSTLLTSSESVLDCMLYVDLNAVRAGLVTRPEDYKGSSIYLRELNKSQWLVPLSLVFNLKQKGLVALYKERLYHRGAVPSKPGQKPISEETLKAEARRGYEQRGAYCKKLRFFTDGLVLGSELVVLEHLAQLRKQKKYTRRKKAITLPLPQLFSLREQRGNFRVT